MADRDRVPMTERVYNDRAPVTVSDGDWTTSPAMMELLHAEGANAWRKHIAKQLTRDQLAGMSPDEITKAQQDGRLDRAAAGG